MPLGIEFTTQGFLRAAQQVAERVLHGPALAPMLPLIEQRCSQPGFYPLQGDHRLVTLILCKPLKPGGQIRRTFLSFARYKAFTYRCICIGIRTI
ncbi:hypothetical protein ALO94_101173 [Pseudomonas syringae pv. spinaceae]|uniref:Uncharacterized protein n=1 Tax=Pseudomonas syringae pv. spinaceae TaxID=264459 RepID=A0A0N8SXA2_PSESX|nr:hypothetical protein ALO94_101173 [Pseudomonas syringae pv. spinaceae]